MKDDVPLFPLKSFEAAARHSSFLKAAEELNLTPAAVAYQVRRLEETLGTELFHRLHKGVALNDSGREFRAYVVRALDEVRKGGHAVRSRSCRKTIRIVTLHCLIEKWLFPRLQAFRVHHPDLHIEVTASEKPIDLDASDDAIWISHSETFPLPSHSELLFDTWMAPVCSPRIANSIDTDKSLLLSEQPRLYDIFWDDDWRRWLVTYGGEALAQRHEGLGFNLYSMVIQAATGGMGLAMGHDALVQSDIADGRLTYPFDCFCKCPKSFYLTTGRVSDDAEVFLAWLRAEALAQRARSAAFEQRSAACAQ